MHLSTPPPLSPQKESTMGFFVFARVLNSSVLYSVQRDGEWRCHLASVVQHIGLYFQIHAWFPEPASPDDSQGGHKADHLPPFSQSLHDIPLSVAPSLVKAISQIPSAFCLLAIISQPSQSPEEPAGKPVYLVSHLEPVSQNPIISWRNPIFTPAWIPCSLKVNVLFPAVTTTSLSLQSPLIYQGFLIKLREWGKKKIQKRGFWPICICKPLWM